ncbi:MAG: DUF1614 domain-containing protein [Patescibacteria group bacterium]
MALGLILLAVVSVLVLLGLAHRVLDRMYLSDGGALLFLGGMIAGSFIEIPLLRGPNPVSINVGGAILPAGLAVYVLSRAGTAWEKWRAIIAAVVTAGAVYALAKFVNFGEKQMPLDPLYLFAILAGTVAYLVGRSRRTAFISATLGLLLMDVVHVFEVRAMGTRAATRIGGAGAFDSIILAGLLAVALTEIFGETRERLGGGPYDAEHRPAGLRREEILERLGDDRGKR